MDLSPLIKHRARPAALLGGFSVPSGDLVEVHARPCPVPRSEVLPTGPFHVVGCADCSNMVEVAESVSTYKHFRKEWTRASSVVLTVDPSSHYLVSQLARFRQDHDPKWQTENPIRGRLTQVKVKGMRKFLDVLWRDSAEEAFQAPPFVTASALDHVVLSSPYDLCYTAPRAIIEGELVKNLEIKNSTFALVRTTKEAASNLDEDPWHDSAYQGLWDPSLLEEPFPEMWPLALELMRNDASMSINDALLSAKLVAAPSAVDVP